MQQHGLITVTILHEEDNRECAVTHRRFQLLHARVIFNMFFFLITSNRVLQEQLNITSTTVGLIMEYQRLQSTFARCCAVQGKHFHHHFCHFRHLHHQSALRHPCPAPLLSIAGVPACILIYNFFVVLGQVALVLFVLFTQGLRSCISSCVKLGYPRNQTPNQRYQRLSRSICAQRSRNYERNEQEWFNNWLVLAWFHFLISLGTVLFQLLCSTRRDC